MHPQVTKENCTGTSLTAKDQSSLYFHHALLRVRALVPFKERPKTSSVQLRLWVLRGIACIYLRFRL